MGQSIHCCLTTPVKSLAVSLVVLFTSSLFALKADGFIQSLEKEQMFMSRSGASLSKMVLIKGDYDAVEKALTKDLNALTTLFPQVKFIRLFQTESKKRIVYMKLAGLGDGVGVMMEVVSGAEAAFQNAPVIPELTSTRALAKIPVEVDEVKSRVENALAANGAPDALRRSVGSGSRIVLQGPLNELEAMPYLAMNVILSVDRYQVTRPFVGGQPVPVSDEVLAKVGTYPLVSVRAGFARIAPTREFGDFRGFDMNLAERVGEQTFSLLRQNLKSVFVNGGE